MHTGKDIESIIYDILKKSKSLDVFPTPIDQILEYCELHLGNSNYFHNIPKNYIAKNVDVFNRMLKKVFGVLDREIKHIYIDPSLPNVKQTFVKLHEAGHHDVGFDRIHHAFTGVRADGQRGVRHRHIRQHQRKDAVFLVTQWIAGL